jgi:hypothetical protein
MSLGIIFDTMSSVFPHARHEDVWVSIAIVPIIFNLDIRCGWSLLEVNNFPESQKNFPHYMHQDALKKNASCWLFSDVGDILCLH